MVVDKSISLVDNPARHCFSNPYTLIVDGKAIGYAHRPSAAHTVADFWITTDRVTPGKTI